VLGHTLREQKPVPIWYVAAGVALIVAGGTLSLHDSHAGLFEESTDVEIWKWALYGGLLLVTMILFDRSLPRVLAWVRLAALTVRTTGVIGQLALPLFVVDLLARD